MKDNKYVRYLFLVCLSLFGQSVMASFHQWEITEIYSNADGSVQFIELFTSGEGQNFLSGHNITAADANGMVNSIFTFPANITTPTRNQFLLLATPGFSDVFGSVQADFEIPAQFLSSASGSVNFAGVDSFTYNTLPTDGSLSVNTGLQIATNSPTNFAGESGRLFSNFVDATFDLTTYILDIPFVLVTDSGSSALYAATLNFTADNPMQFTLATANVVNTLIAQDETATFDSSTGVLNIRSVLVDQVRYSAVLNLVPETNPFVFQLESSTSLQE